MSKEQLTNELIFYVLTRHNVLRGALSAWVRLAILYGFEEVDTTTPKIAEDMLENYNTVKKYLQELRRAGAVQMRGRYAKGSVGSRGVVMRVIHPFHWKVDKLKVDPKLQTR